MQTFSLETLSMEEAKALQFKLVDTITRNFSGDELFGIGDVGVVPGLGRPRATAAVEKALADFFGAEDAALVRSAGTGSIRFALQAIARPGDKILIHDAPVYSTTMTTMEFTGLELIKVDMNSTEKVIKALTPDIKLVYIQHSRQRISDKYDMYNLIREIRKVSDIPIVTDENYTVLKTKFIGTQLGADASCFSTFKLLGPEGIGCVIGNRKVTERIREMNYSGGGQVQGHEAMEALRAMVYVPVMMSIQSEEIDKVISALNNGSVDGVKAAYLANAQSRTILVEFIEPIAFKVVEAANAFGAANYPVGAESKYEITPMFYRLSGTFLKDNPELKDYMIRLNPMRAGSSTVLRILENSVKKVR